jgi:hypothetical protein
MRNHNEKARDMARSVLPSTARKAARKQRALIHGRERARLRAALHESRTIGDPDDFEGDLVWIARRNLEEMVDDRRGADKVGPLLAWAERLVETVPALTDASLEDREFYFRKILPPGLIGNHAISHLRWILDDDRRTWSWSRANPQSRPTADVDLVAEILTAGCHGELNRRIRSTIAPVIIKRVRLPAERVVDDEHPAPGWLVPARWVEARRRRHVRFLAGAHDVDAFVKDASLGVIQVVRAFHAEVVGRAGARH